MLNKRNSTSLAKRKFFDKTLVSGALFALLSNPVNAGVFNIEYGNNWQDNSEQTENISGSNKSINYYQQELEKAKEKLKKTRDYGKKREIMKYIQILEQTIQQKRQNSPADQVIEHREYAEYPRTVHFDIVGGGIEMNTVDVKIKNPKDIFKKSSYTSDSGVKKLTSYSANGGDLSLSQGETIKGELKFGNQGRYSENFEIQYDGQEIIVKVGGYNEYNNSREYQSKPIPATPSNKGENKVYLYQGYNNQEVGVIKINLDWRE